MPRVVESLAQCLHFWRDEAEVFGDNGQWAKGGGEGVEERLTGRVHPLAMHRRLNRSGDLPEPFDGGRESGARRVAGSRGKSRPGAPYA